MIEYRIGKTNPINSLSQRPNYKESEASQNKESYLLTLYNKLRIVRLGVLYDLIQRSSVIIEIGPRHSQTNKMLGLIESHQDPKSNPNRVTYIQESQAINPYNRVVGQSPLLEPITSIASYRQRVLQKVVIVILSTKTVYRALSELIRNDLLEL